MLMLKPALLAGAMMLCASAASAQALPSLSYAATPSTPWAGPYVGIHAGYAWDSDNFTGLTGQAANNVAAIASGARPGGFRRDRDGYVAGGQAGWNVQHGMFVAGAEADISATDLSGGGRYTGSTGATAGVYSRADYLGSVRGRLGVASDRFLVYGTGGFAYGGLEQRALFRNAAGVVDFSGRHDYDAAGWVAGVGAEYLMPTNWAGRYGAKGTTLRVEYLHYGLGDKTINVGSVGGSGGYNARFSNDADVVRGGLNFKF